MKTNNVSLSVISTIRDEAFNLAQEIILANANFAKLKASMVTNNVEIPRHENEGDITYLKRVTLDLTAIESQLQATEAREAIERDLCIASPGQPNPTVNLRRPTSLVGRWLNKASQLVG